MILVIILYYHSTLVSVFTVQMNADTRTPQAPCHTHTHSRARTLTHKNTHRRTERWNNANNVSVRVSAARLCVRHYPIILSGAGAAQAGILTTASVPTCTAALPPSSGSWRSNHKVQTSVFPETCYIYSKTPMYLINKGGKITS